MALLSETPFRAGVSRATNDLWVAFGTVLLHAALLRRKYTAGIVVYALLCSFKMNSLLIAPVMFFVYYRELPLKRYGCQLHSFLTTS